MILLGIDTATHQVSCALGGNEGIFGAVQVCRGQRHAEVLTPAIQFLSNSTGVSLREVSCVVVDNGPGLFTGLRVGIATARAIATALHIPMIGIPSLDAMAYQQRGCTKTIIPVIDAKRGEVFWARYRATPGGVQRLSDMCATSPEVLDAELTAIDEETLLVGNGVATYGHVFTSARHVEMSAHESTLPTATALVALGHGQAMREEWTRPDELPILYLRKSDAEIKKNTQDAQGTKDAQNLQNASLSAGPLKKKNKTSGK